MNRECKEIIWGQFGAALDTLENLIRACPDSLWSEKSPNPQYWFWYMVYHTLFFLDYYLSESTDDFHPPAPFTLSELDPSGVLPDRVYTKDELLAYLEYGRLKCRSTIAGMTAERAEKMYHFRKADISHAELLLYSLRHVQHHAAQLNMIMRQTNDLAVGWVFQAKSKLDD